MDAPLISTFSDTRATKPSGSLSLEQFIADIRNGRWREPVEAFQGERLLDPKQADLLKKALPAVTPGGRFSTRHNGGLTDYSQVIVVDVDKVGSQRAAEIRWQAQSDPHALAAFLSPSGEGVKLFFRTATASTDHVAAWENAARYVRAEYQVEIDASGKDVARLCFVSADPGAFYNKGATVLPPVASAASGLTALTPHGEVDELDFLAPLADNVPLELVASALDALSPDMPYPEWMGIAAALRHQFPHEPAASEAYELFNLWSSTGNKYAGEDDTLKTWDSLKHTPKGRNPVTIRSLLHKAQAEGWTRPSERAGDKILQSASAKKQLAEWLNTRRFDVNSPPPCEPCIFKLAGVSVSTPGNIAVVSAPIKTGKSNFIAAGLASTFALGANPLLREWDGKPDFLGWESDGNPQDKYVLHFDTEQSLEHHYRTVSRALLRAGVSSPPSSFKSYCVTGESAARLVAAVILAVEDFIPKGGIHSIWIDGIADLVSSPNEEAECNALVAQIRNLAMKACAPVICTLHWNPGTEKTRGHLGSELERKAQSVLSMNKEKDGSVKVTMPLKSRDAPIYDSTAPRFAWSPIHEMHVSIPPSVEKVKKPGAPSKYDLGEILGADSLSKDGFRQRAQKKGMSPSHFNKRLREEIDRGSFLEGDDGLISACTLLSGS
jgi:hypothetical protein